MDSAIVDKIRELAVRAEKPQIIKGVEHEYHIFHEGSLIPVFVPPEPRNHFASTPADLVNALHCLKAECTAAKMQADLKKCIWYDDAEVVGVFEDSDRRDTITLSLAKSEQFDVVHGLCAKQPVNQKQFLRLLRHDLYGCGTDSLANSVKAVKFSVRNEGHTAVAQGRASLGNSIEAQLTGVDDLPEQVTLSVPMYNNPLIQVFSQIVCTLEVDPQLQSFHLVPVPGAIQQACANATNVIAERIVQLVDALYPANAETDGSPRISVFRGKM